MKVSSLKLEILVYKQGRVLESWTNDSIELVLCVLNKQQTAQ